MKLKNNREIEGKRKKMFVEIRIGPTEGLE